MRTLIVLMIVATSVAMASASGQPSKPHGNATKHPHTQLAVASQPAQQPEADKRGTEQFPLFTKAYALPTPESTQQAADVRQENVQRAEIDRKTFWIGLGTISILIVQVAVFLWQGIQLRSSVKEMRDASKATREVAEAIVTTGRPWLGIEKWQIATDDKKRPTVIGNIKNAGSGVATNVVVSFGLRLCAPGSIPDFPAIIENSPSNLILPGVSKHLMPTEGVEDEIAEAWADILDSKRILWIVGMIEYDYPGRKGGPAITGVRQRFFPQFKIFGAHSDYAT